MALVALDLVSGLLAAFYMPLAYYATSGMETVPFAALTAFVREWSACYNHTLDGEQPHKCHLDEYKLDECKKARDVFAKTYAEAAPHCQDDRIRWQLLVAQDGDHQ